MRELVSIDFSITSTAMVIDRRGELLHFVFVPAVDKTSKFKVHRALEGLVEVVEYGAKPVTADEYALRDAEKLAGAQRLSAAIVGVIARECTGPRVVFEGFSFASKGASFIDLIVYNSFAKKAIMDRFGQCVSVLAPGTIKSRYSGKGNNKKPEMYEAFLRREAGPLRDAILSVVGPYSPAMKLPKPVDDLVDAVAINAVADT